MKVLFVKSPAHCERCERSIAAVKTTASMHGAKFEEITINQIYEHPAYSFIKTCKTDQLPIIIVQSSNGMFYDVRHTESGKVDILTLTKILRELN